MNDKDYIILPSHQAELQELERGLAQRQKLDPSREVAQTTVSDVTITGAVFAFQRCQLNAQMIVQKQEKVVPPSAYLADVFKNGLEFESILLQRFHQKCVRLFEVLSQHFQEKGEPLSLEVPFIADVGADLNTYYDAYVAGDAAAFFIKPKLNLTADEALQVYGIHESIASEPDLLLLHKGILYVIDIKRSINPLIEYGLQLAHYVNVLTFQGKKVSHIGIIVHCAPGFVFDRDAGRYKQEECLKNLVAEDVEVDMHQPILLDTLKSLTSLKGQPFEKAQCYYRPVTCSECSFKDICYKKMFLDLSPEHWDIALTGMDESCRLSLLRSGIRTISDLLIQPCPVDVDQSLFEYYKHKVQNVFLLGGAINNRILPNSKVSRLVFAVVKGDMHGYLFNGTDSFRIDSKDSLELFLGKLPDNVTLEVWYYSETEMDFIHKSLTTCLFGKELKRGKVNLRLRQIDEIIKVETSIPFYGLTLFEAVSFLRGLCSSKTPQQVIQAWYDTRATFKPVKDSDLTARDKFELIDEFWKSLCQLFP